jgi:hypothetical protein
MRAARRARIESFVQFVGASLSVSRASSSATRQPLPLRGLVAGDADLRKSRTLRFLPGVHSASRPLAALLRFPQQFTRVTARIGRR